MTDDRLGLIMKRPADAGNMTARQYLLSKMLRAGFSLEDFEAIERGMQLTSFRGELPRDPIQRGKLVASWLEQGRLQ
jgi:hypothetical protein